MSENGYARCAGTTNAGNPCRSKAINGSEYCMFHAENHQELQQRGADVSVARRSVRDRFREDAERIYDSLFRSLVEAIEQEIVKWTDCPNCNHKVPCTFPDIRARTQAIQVLLDQGYGKPPITIREAEPAPQDAPWAALTREQREQLYQEALAELARRKALPAEARNGSTG